MIQIIGMAPTDRNLGSAALRRDRQITRRTRRNYACLPALVALAALAATPGCKHRELPPAPPAPVAPKPAAPKPAPPRAAPPADAPTADTKAAAVWIDALRERDPGAVLAKTQVPFDFRDASRKKRCGTRAATTRAAAASVTSCLAKDETFHADLSATPEPRLITIDAGTLPPWAKAWAKTLRPGLRPISTFVHGEKEARELVLLVGDDGVHGLWQNVTVEPK
jgi:hypothetical protein